MAGLSVVCSVSSIRTNIHQRGIHAKIYEQIVETYSSDDIIGIQLIPDGWPKLLKIKLRNAECRDTMLVQGVKLFGTSVSFKSDDRMLTKVLVKDADMEWDEEKIKQLFEEYGEIVKVEREYIYFKGERTETTTGTWYIFFLKIATPIPRRREFQIDDRVYPLQMFYPGQGTDNNQTENTTSSQTYKRYCGKCGEQDHQTGECKHTDPVCFTCKKSDHATKDCPENDGAKLGEGTLVFYNQRCPLSNWSTEYPFRAHEKEYICVEQYVQEEKCHMFGDSRSAREVMEETDPRMMREHTKNIRNYNHKEWMNNIETVMYEGMKAKFTDIQASGAKDYLFCTKERVIGEATRNTVWGTGIPIGDSNATDNNKWTGANITGLMLMDLRDKLMPVMRVQTVNESSSSTSVNVGSEQGSSESDTESESSEATGIEEEQEEETPESPSTSFLEEAKNGATKDDADITRVAVVLGDHNTVNLPVANSDVPFDIHVCSLVDSKLSEIKEQLKDNTIHTDIDSNKVDIVVLHLGIHEWDTKDGMVKTAESVYVDYEKLLNQVSDKYPQLTEYVISGVPLAKFGDNPTDTQQKVNDQIAVLNQKLFELSNSQRNVHFINNEDDLYIDPNRESLHTTPITLNDKGRDILADNLRVGICDSVGRSMMPSSLDNPGWIRKV